MKIWTSPIKGDDKIIAFFNQSIYKANPSSRDVDEYTAQIQSDCVPSKNALEIPLSYIREISLENGRKYIDVQFGSDSNEHFVITDMNQRQEIFDYIKQNLPVESSTVTYSKIQAAKTPLIALAVVAGLFIWTLSIAIDIEHGFEYTVVGQQNSTSGLVLMVAYMGVRNVVLIFGALLSIAVFAVVRKIKNPPTVQRLLVKR